MPEWSGDTPPPATHTAGGDAYELREALALFDQTTRAVRDHLWTAGQSGDLEQVRAYAQTTLSAALKLARTAAAIANDTPQRHARRARRWRAVVAAQAGIPVSGEVRPEGGESAHGCHDL